MIDAYLVDRVADLRPLNWRLHPYRYIRQLEAFSRDVLRQLEDERDAIVQIPYRCPKCGADL